MFAGLTCRSRQHLPCGVSLASAVWGRLPLQTLGEEEIIYTFPPMQVCVLPFCSCLTCLSTRLFHNAWRGFFFKFIISVWPLFIHLFSFSDAIWKSLHCLQTSIISGTTSDVYLVFPLRAMHLSFSIPSYDNLSFHPFLSCIPSWLAPSFPTLFLPSFQKYNMFYLSVIFIDFFCVWLEVFLVC